MHSRVGLYCAFCYAFLLKERLKCETNKVYYRRCSVISYICNFIAYIYVCSDFGYCCNFCFALPFILLTIRHKLSNVLMIFVASLFVTIIVSQPMNLVKTIMFGLIGIVLGYMYKTRKSQ